MDFPIVGVAWPQEHDQLRHMAQVLEVATRFQALVEPGQAKVLSPTRPMRPPARSRRAADGGPAMRGR